jgi:amidase
LADALRFVASDGGAHMSFSTATALVAALHSRRLSAMEALDQSIARIQEHDGGLNAVVVRDFDRARSAASAADADLARGERRPLLGVPMTVKESFNVAGLPTTWGIPGTGGTPAQRNAVAVARLKAAGAILLGKTNVATNLGDWQSFNPVYGLTRNPWDLARTPGGSSGGAAAALAAGFVPLELGSDLAGSLRVPAHCCGVFAHKPTHGLIPTRGHVPPGVPELSVNIDPDLAVVGPMARSAGDLALALEVLAGPDDAQAVGYRLALAPPRHARLDEFKVLVLDEHPLLPLSNEVRTALERFTANLQRAGCTIERSSPPLPDLELVARTFRSLLLSFIGANLPEAVYRGLQEQVARLPNDENNPGAIRLRALVASHRDWIDAHRTRIFLMHQCRDLFRTWDLVLCPVLPTVAFPHDEAEMERRAIDIDGRSVPYTLQGVWAGLASVCGLPATVLPIGLGSGGLPIGLQVVGPYLEDRSTIGFAELAEREFGGFLPPPGYK